MFLCSLSRIRPSAPMFLYDTRSMVFIRVLGVFRCVCFTHFSSKTFSSSLINMYYILLKKLHLFFNCRCLSCTHGYLLAYPYPYRIRPWLMSKGMSNTRVPDFMEGRTSIAHWSDKKSTLASASVYFVVCTKAQAITARPPQSQCPFLMFPPWELCLTGGRYEGNSRKHKQYKVVK